jgi:uncharacterized membrane protein
MAENRLESMQWQLKELSQRLERLEGWAARAGASADPPAAPTAPVRESPRPPRRRQLLEDQPLEDLFPRRRRTDRTLEDFATPRSLAIAGGIAVTLGLAFLVSYGISEGWITEGMRVILAAIFSGALATSGVILLERHHQGAPAMALLLSGLVGMFLTLVAATRLYDLVSMEVGVTLATLVGIAATLVALRWDSQATACLAIGGTLVSPLLVGADYAPATLAFLAPVYLVAMAVTAARRWPVLYGMSLGVMLISVAAIQAGGAFTAPQAFAVAVSGALISGLGLLGRSLLDRSEPKWQAPMYGVAAALIGGLGYLLITKAGVPAQSDAALPDTLGKVWLFSFAALSGITAWRLHVAGLVDSRRAALTAAVAAFAWGLGEVLHGPALVVSWSAAAAVTVIAARHDWERWVGLGVAGLAVGHTLIHEIPPDALAHGVDSLSAAWIAGGALVVAAGLIWAYGAPRWSGPAGATALGLLLYLVSVTIVDLAQPDTAAFGAGTGVSALDTAARGQVIVSSLWALCGLGLVVAGLRRGQSRWRSAGLVLLGLAAAKITIFDLASLSTAARTISFIVVGLVFLAAAFAYQAMFRRPER